MKNRCILISGHSLACDEMFCAALQKIAEVVKTSENSQIEAIMATRPVDLVIIEISKENPIEVELIKEMKTQYPHTVFILIDGDKNREVIARAFSYGAKDAFRQPYNRALVTERVKALLDRKDIG